MSHIIPMPNYRLVANLSTPVYLLDNSAGTAVIKIVQLLVSPLSTVIQPMGVLLMKNYVIGTLTNHQTLTVQQRKSDLAAPDVLGLLPYGAAGSAGITGVTGGEVVDTSCAGGIYGAPVKVLENYELAPGGNLGVVLVTTTASSLASVSAHIDIIR